MSMNAEQAALVAEIGRLRRAVEELSVLNDLARAIGGSHDPGQIIDIIVDRSGKAVQAEQVTITLVDEDARVSAGTLVRYRDDTPGNERFHLDQSLLGYMLHHKQPYLCADLAADPLLGTLALPPSLRGLLAVPLLVKSRLIGVLIAFNKRGGNDFDESDQRLLSIIGAQSGQVLETARLLEQEKEADRMRGELRLAERIQKNLLPQQMPELPGYEVAGASWPAEAIGGDYYDFLPLDATRLAFCLGDVAGKGLPASLLMANLQASWRGHALRSAACAECVSWCNRLLFRSSAPERFATLFHGVIDAHTHTLAYCNAGHERPLHVTAAGEISRLATGGLVVGMMEDSAYQDGLCSLEPGDVITVFSDGATDMEDAAGAPVGEERLIDLVRRCRTATAGEIVAGVSDAIRAHAGTTPALDDLTLVVIKRRV